MKFLHQMILGAVVAVLALPAAARADLSTNATPDFKEVYDLVHTHLTGEGDTELNRDAVDGLLSQLHGKVSIVASKSGPMAATNEPALAKPMVYEGGIGYLRAERVEEGLAGQISAAFKELNSSNKLKGLVMDLRFADGNDYAEAAAVADLFLAKEQPMLDWGKGFVKSTEKSNAFALPVMVLINQKTSAAAEALAAVMREDDRALLLGGKTAGDAAMSQEFPLKSGGYLRIATAPVKVADGESLSSKGVTPDIAVDARPEDELAYLNDPYKELQARGGLAAAGAVDLFPSGTNRVARPHQLTEADLIRVRKEKPGVELDDLPASSLSGNETDEARPVIRDPVLARALDLIKGISVMQHVHPS